MQLARYHQNASHHRNPLKDVGMNNSENGNNRLTKINDHIKAVCGLYSRVARKLGLDRSFVSRVARGERKSTAVESALIAEFEQTETDSPAV
jgi:hypothetical protein